MFQGNGIHSSRPIDMKGNGVRHSGNGTRHNNNIKPIIENHSSNSTPIPIQGKVRQTKKVRRRSTTESTDSTDSLSNPGTPQDAEHSPVQAFSRSFSNGHSNSNLNVYNMSPRSTSVMFQYYSTPRRFYQSSSVTNARGCYSNDYTNGYLKKSLMRTTSECKSPEPTVLSGIPPTLQQDVMEDPRRRAYSESAKKEVNSSMHMSRLSALKKLKKKLARSGSLRNKHHKEETNNQGNDKSMERINSLEKVEEGRPFRSRLVDQNSNHCSAKRNIFCEEDEMKFTGLSIHEENETNIKKEGHINSAASFTDLDTKNEEDCALLIYQRFLEEHSCYDVMPTSCRLVVFDTLLPACKAFNALILNSVRSAPLWDAKQGVHIGMLTVTDFIKVIVTCHKSPLYRVETLEDLTLDSWRNILKLKPAFTSINPSDTLLHSLHILLKNHFHGVPVVDDRSGDVFHIINYKRILRFLYLFIHEIPKPRFMKQSLGECKIGTFKNVATVQKNQTLLDALEIIVDQQLTALPVVNEYGEVVDVFCKLDIIPLAAHRMYHHLDMKISTALSYRHLPLVDDTLPDESSGNSPHPIRPPPTPTSVSSPNPSTITSHLDYYSQRTEQRKSAVRGHTVVRPGRNNHNSPTPSNKLPQSPLSTSKNQTGATSRHQQPMTSYEPNILSSRTRHNSFSNPLVKCRLTDSLLYVIDRLVSTEANLLVVVKETSDKMIGVVTVSDVLRFITCFKEEQPSPLLAPTRSSDSSDQSLPLGSSGELIFGDFCASDNTLFEGTSFLERSRKISDSSTHMMNDSGYSSSSTMRLKSNNFDSKSFKGQVLKVGAEMERA